MGDFKRKSAAVAAVTTAAVSGLLASSLVPGSPAGAQVDPFAAATAPRPAQSRTGGAAGQPASVANPAQANRVGFTGVDQAVGASYAGAQTKGFASTAQIRTLPKYAPPIPLTCKLSNGKVAGARPKIAIPTYALAVIRQGGVRASAAGQGSDITPRATSISTVLIGVDDELAGRIADEAYADLVKKLTTAGFEVVPADRLQADKELARLQVVGAQTKGENGWSVYAPKAAPLRSGHPLTRNALSISGSNIVLNDVSVEEDAVTLMPHMVIDYATYEGTGNRRYVGSASAGMDLRFRVAQSGALIENGATKGKGGGFGGSLRCDPSGTDEAFGVLFEIDDKSDDVGVSNAFALAGLGSLYRQSKYYGVEAVPERYAALARAAYQGFNQTLVDELQKARAAK